MTYKQAYDKIIEAYFKNQIEPYLSSFCFCGTLCDNKTDWRADKYEGIFSGDVHKDFMHYTGKQYADMERALLLPLVKVHIYSLRYEDTLFEGMCAALDVLKSIHKERGEDVDEELKLTKRNLIPA